MSNKFSHTKSKISELTGEKTSTSITTTTTSIKNGDTHTVAQFEEISPNSNMDKIVISINEPGHTYAKTVIYNYCENPHITLFDWVEVDPEIRYKGVGRIFIEEILEYIDSNTNTKTIFIQLENPDLQRILIDNGFSQERTNTNLVWYTR